MSSFDPDDTTPLINPQEGSNANHGTFNGNQEGEDDEPLEQGAEQSSMTDDEILDGSQPSGIRRFNPFDRVPNLPPQLQEELAVVFPPESRWTRFKR